MKIAKKIIFSLMVLGLLAPLKIFALEIDWPASPAGTNLSDQSTLTELTKYSYEWAITLGILAFFVSIVINGVKYMTSTGDPGKTANVRKRIQSSAAGLGLLLGSWILLNFLNPRLTTLFIPDPNQDLATQMIEYEDFSKLKENSCDLIIIYPKKNYEEDSNFDPPKEVLYNSAKSPIDFKVSFFPHSLKVLKQIKGDEQLVLMDQANRLIREENEKIRKANEEMVRSGVQGPPQVEKPEKTLNEAIKEKYGSDPFPYSGGLFVDAPPGCVAYFYRKDPKYLSTSIFGTEDVLAFQMYGSNPDFNTLYSENELNQIKKFRVVIPGTVSE
ncbi:MAG: pilin [Candidatus Paceibacterota bacterium]|jgi:hypothetical protein